MLFFNNAVQNDNCTFDVACYDQANDVKDGKEMILYLMTEQEAKNLRQTCEYYRYIIQAIIPVAITNHPISSPANEIFGELVEEGWKCPDPLSQSVKVPPITNKFNERPQFETRREDRKPSVADTGEKWNCVQCTFANESSHINCSICETAR